MGAEDAPVDQLRPLLILIFVYMCVGSSLVTYGLAFAGGMFASKRCPAWLEASIVDPLVASFLYINRCLQNIKIEVKPEEHEKEQDT